MTTILIVLLELFLGPLRRPYLRHARYTVPATIGALLGLGIGSYVGRRASMPPPHTAVLAMVMAIGLATSFGQAFKSWYDHTFGPKK